VRERPQHLQYDAGGLPEQLLCFGEENSARRLLIIPPLFDEMNRVRRVLVTAMRALGAQGVSCLLPDLPGTNESQAALSAQSLDSWKASMVAVAQRMKATHIASIRGGTLLDGLCPELPHWRLAPVSGGSLLKTMLRTRIAGDKEAGVTTSMDDLMLVAQSAPLALAGSQLGPSMVAQLVTAEPAPLPRLRSLTLGEGPDQLVGSALWLRTEPQDDPDMAMALCAELDRWSASCGG
jgi:hypothetical protein